MQDKDGGIRHGPTELNIKSTEENINAFGLFMMLHDVTGESKYKDAAKKILQWLPKVYDTTQGMFLRGMQNKSKEDQPAKWEVDHIYATDANALAIIVIGPQILDKLKSKNEYISADKIMGSLADRKVELLTESGDKILGYDYTDKVGRGDRDAVISPEMTAHVVKAHKVMSRYYAEQGEDLIADIHAKQAESLLTSIQQLAVNSLLGISFPDSTLPKDAIGGQIKRYHDSNFNTVSLASLNSLWIVLAKEDVNPFDVRANDQVPLMPVSISEEKGFNAEIIKQKTTIQTLLIRKQNDPKSWTDNDELELNQSIEKINEMIREYTKGAIFTATEEDETTLKRIIELLSNKAKGIQLTDAEIKELEQKKASHPYYEGWIRLSALSEKNL